MTNYSSTSIASAPSATRAQSRIVPALLALGFGVFLFVGTGFAAPSMIHNATHDTRHAFGLPCH
jgi:cobalt transporter subunit CbtB